MAKRGPSWWYLHIGIKVGSFWRAVRKVSTVFLRCVKWLLQTDRGGTSQKKKKHNTTSGRGYVSLNGEHKISNGDKYSSIVIVKAVNADDNSKTEKNLRETKLKLIGIFAENCKVL